MGERKYRRELTPVKKKYKAVTLAGERMNRALAHIKREYSCLIDAVNYLQPVAVEEKLGGIATDGRKIFYHAEELDRGVSDECLEFRILHIIFHGLLGHFARGSDYDNRKLAWDVMDLQVVRLFNESGINYENFEILMQQGYPDVRSLFKEQTGFSLYYNAGKDPALQRRVKQMSNMVRRLAPGDLDDHSTWALPRLEVEIRPLDAQDVEGWMDITGAMTGLAAGSLPKELENALARAIRRSASGGFSHGRGNAEGEEVVAEAEGLLCYMDLIDEVSKVVEMSAEEDEIDPAVYEYGLSLYGNVPLIEPLEYRCTYALGSVVIAIDTSGSCGEFLKEFWTETVQIFREIGQRGSIGKLHYLECDAEIDYEKEYGDVDELETTGNPGHSFCGFGGTDFCPVFERAEEYEKEGEKIDLLIYFSDGIGDYPDTPPEYPVYFVFPTKQEYEYSEQMRPGWVNSLILKKETGR